MSNKVLVGKMLEDIREQSPLIHNITNYVVMNFTANALLSVGASPVMAHAEEEVEEMVGHAKALVINIGTLSQPWINSMERAMRAALQKGIPVVLDPVGAGATAFRTETSRSLVRNHKPTIIRGNASEILAVAGRTFNGTKGVDSTHAAHEAADVAKELARSQGCIVCVSGQTDYITDGSQTALVKNGHAWMSKVTGMGCTATALIGAMSAVSSDRFAATVSAMALMGVCGELAAKETLGLGGFQIKFIDSLFQIQPKQVDELARIEISA